ncbi:MAG: hypothetical protein ABJ275_03970 [Maricaulaceae bacterium]
MLKNLMMCTVCGIYLSGCATVTRGSNTKMIIDTEPPGAMVLTDKELASSKKARKQNPDLEPQYYGCPSTPCEIKMSRRSEFIMTISLDGYEDVEVGVDSGIHKESLNADVAGSAGLGATFGLGVGALAGGLSGGGIATGVAAGAAGIATGGLLVVSVGVDAASGALLNLRPNPVVLTLPPKGTEFAPHPKVEEIRAKRAKKQEN